jgi:hypothetical protein
VEGAELRGDKGEKLALMRNLVKRAIRGTGQSTT